MKDITHEVDEESKIQQREVEYLNKLLGKSHNALKNTEERVSRLWTRPWWTLSLILWRQDGGWLSFIHIYI